MIKLNNLEKYYNRNRNNEIHVINDINLSLPEKGLVVLLGPSGSGKTTLLNVLGGLDKVNAGRIIFDDIEINKYKSGVWDEIRNKHVGYVFQNYNLLSSMTVYDNIALTLNMVGITDKAEIDKRIEYILGKIGMANYRKRRASQLSGGQQQRVAIARALAKNPKVIIADEPTGNLDSKNTVDIMNIIKNISKTKLVVLVTHEKEIADFYADRVIRLEDGKIISDEVNKSEDELNLHHDQDIYLKDLHKISDIEDQSSKLSVYSDEELETNFSVKLIVKNKTIYLDVSNDNYKKTQLLDSDSEVKIFDKHFEKVKKNSLEETEFNLEAISSEELTQTNKSVITIKESLSIAWKRLTGLSKLGKLFYLGFVGGAMLIAISVGLLANIYYYNPEEFLSASDQIVTIDYDDGLGGYDGVLDLENSQALDYVSVINTNTALTFDMPAIYQSWNSETSYKAYGVRSDYLDPLDILIGRKAEDYNELVLDKVVVEKMLDSDSFKNLGITSYEALMNIDILIPFSNGLKDDGSYQTSGDEFVYPIHIVGISDTQSPVYYTQEETIFMLETNTAVYEVFKDSITLSEGSLPSELKEAIMIDNPQDTSPLNLRAITLMNQTYKVSGLYTSDSELPSTLVPFELLKEQYFTQSYTTRGTVLHLYANDIDQLIQDLKTKGIEAKSLFAVEEDAYKTQRLLESVSYIVFALVILAASSLSFYFILRSSLISRIYEVSVYRALGVSKFDIKKMFVIEVLLITTLTSLVGYILMTYLLLKLQGIVGDFTEVFRISFLSLSGGILVIYLVNLVSGLIPISNLLRKTPAEILSKYDF